MKLPPFVTHGEVQRRLMLIFPEGAPYRSYCTREFAASTVFVMLYIGAIEDSNRYLSPKYVYRMSDDQAALTSDAARIEYADEMILPGSKSRGEQWYADTSREPIRDETLRNGLLLVGAAVERKDLATTSSKPRYALTREFAALFNPSLDDNQLTATIAEWQNTYLAAGALARVALVRAGVSKSPTDFLVTFPNGETRNLTPGASSMISKHVVEAFAPRFLEAPGVLWLSESSNKVIKRDDILAKKIGLNIDAGRNLPDIILVDVASSGTLVVFVEVVATDGPVSETRRAELLKLATGAGFSEEHVAFVTAFLDRDSQALRRAFAILAWNSFVWIASEPESIIALFAGSTQSSPLLRDLLSGTRAR
jgi:hypothetical protein